MKKSFLLFAFIICLTAFAPIQHSEESELEMWCKKAVHDWNPLGICVTTLQGSTVLYQKPSLHIGNKETLVITLSSSVRFAIRTPLTVGGSLIVRGNTINWSTLDIQEEGRLDINPVSFQNAGEIKNAGTLLNGGIFLNYYLPRGGPWYQGIIVNQERAALINGYFMRLGDYVEVSDQFINLGIIYHLPCVGSLIITNNDLIAEIEGTNIDLDQCVHLPVTAAD